MFKVIRKWIDLDVKNQGWANKYLFVCFEFEHHDQAGAVEFRGNLYFDIKVSRFHTLELANIAIKIASDSWTGHDRKKLDFAWPS